MSVYKCDSNRNLNTKMRQLKPADLKEKEVFMCNQSELSKNLTNHFVLENPKISQLL